MGTGLLRSPCRWPRRAAHVCRAWLPSCVFRVQRALQIKVAVVREESQCSGTSWSTSMPWWLAGAPVLLGGAPRALLLRVQEGGHGAGSAPAALTSRPLGLYALVLGVPWLWSWSLPHSVSERVDTALCVPSVYNHH